MRIGYWGIKGIAEYNKLCASYLGLEYTEDNITDREAWFKDKETMGFDFPNLPYVIDGDIKLTESNALVPYFAHKANKPEFMGVGLCAIKARMVEEVCRDIKTAFGKAMWAPNAVEELQKFAKDEGMNKKTEQIVHFLCEKDFFFEHVTYVDILIASTALFFDVHLRSVDSESIFLKHAKLAAHCKRVLGLPGIAERVASDAWKKPWIPAAYLKFELKD